MPRRCGLAHGVGAGDSRPVGAARECVHDRARGCRCAARLRATLVKVAAVETDTHRHLGDIEEMIGRAELSQAVKDAAIAVFRRLARAEAHVHGTSVETVHFHEVGAVDAIVDIVGVCTGLDALGIDTLYASALPLGPGWTSSAHGRIPLPAPATLELLAEANASDAPGSGSGRVGDADRRGIGVRTG